MFYFFDCLIEINYLIWMSIGGEIRDENYFMFSYNFLYDVPQVNYVWEPDYICDFVDYIWNSPENSANFDFSHEIIDQMQNYLFTMIQLLDYLHI